MAGTIQKNQAYNIAQQRELLQNIKTGQFYSYMLTEELRDNESFMREVLDANPALFMYASERLRGDFYFAMYAITRDYKNFEFVSDALKHDKNIIIAVVIQNPWYAFSKMPKDMKSARDIVIAAVSTDAWILKEEVPSEMKRDKQVALAAVEQDGAILEYLAPEMQNDRRIVYAAFRQRGVSVLKYASAQVLTDPAFLESIDSETREFIANLLKKRTTEDLVKTVTLPQKSQEELAEERRQEEEKLLYEMLFDYYLIQTLDMGFRGDREFMLKAIKITEENFQYASKKLQNDKSFVIEALKINPKVERYLPDEMLKDEDVLAVLDDIENRD